MKMYANKHRSPHPFKEGDMALVKLRPFCQSSVAGQRNCKLSMHYYGPFRLKMAIGEVAFELELPPTSKLHPVFHVSKLKPYLGTATPSLKLPDEAHDSHPLIKPAAILDYQYGATADQHRVLVQWQGLYPEDASWQSLAELKLNYPNLNLDDRVPVEEEERDVMDPTVDLEEDEGANLADGPNAILQGPNGTLNLICLNRYFASCLELFLF